MTMNTTRTLLALCLLGAGTAFGQNTTSYSSTSATTTYNADSSKSVTPTTNGDASNATDMSTSGSTTTTGQTTNGTTANGTSGSTNSVAPVNSTYSTSTTTTDYNTKAPARPKKGYQGLAVGIYAGLNTTKFKGEALDANGSSSNKLTGRLGYQAGIFIRGGGRVFGQIGAEYFASSSNYFTAGSGQSVKSISSQIDIQYIQVPVYVGYKLTQSDRGISAVRVQVGVEYANSISTSSNSFNISSSELKSGTFNGLGQLGFDAGPLFLDLTYHYGFSNSITQNTGFASSARRILSASVGFKF